jgi:hypothetical protein
MERILCPDIKMETVPTMVIRYKGKWYKVIPKPYESEYQTIRIAWMIVKDGMSPLEAYRRFFKEEQNMAKLLYPSFRKDGQ